MKMALTTGSLGRTDVVGFDDRLWDTLGRTDVGACVVGAYKLWDTLGCTMLSTFNDFDAFPDFDDLRCFARLRRLP